MDNQREQWRRGDRPHIFSIANRDSSSHRDHPEPEGKTLIVSNIPRGFGWRMLKYIFEKEVGEVAYVWVLKKGTSMVEFNNPEAMKRALNVMQNYYLKGQILVLEEDTVSGNDGNRLNWSRLEDVGGGACGNIQDDMKYFSWGINIPRDPMTYDTCDFIFDDYEPIPLPLVKEVIVSNLDDRVNVFNILDLFKKAGTLRGVVMAVGNEEYRTGQRCINITYANAAQAVQAVTMFNKCKLYNKKMSVRMKSGEERAVRLPVGLCSVEPTSDVATKLTDQLNAFFALDETLGLQDLSLSGLGACQKQLPPKNVAANELATELTAQLNSKLNNLRLGYIDEWKGINSASSQLHSEGTQTDRQMGGVAVSTQCDRDHDVQQSNLETTSIIITNGDAWKSSHGRATWRCTERVPGGLLRGIGPLPRADDDHRGGRLFSRKSRESTTLRHGLSSREYLDLHKQVEREINREELYQPCVLVMIQYAK